MIIKSLNNLDTYDLESHTLYGHVNPYNPTGEPVWSSNIATNGSYTGAKKEIAPLSDYQLKNKYNLNDVQLSELSQRRQAYGYLGPAAYGDNFKITDDIDIEKIKTDAYKANPDNIQIKTNIEFGKETIDNAVNKVTKNTNIDSVAKSISKYKVPIAAAVGGLALGALINNNKDR